MDAVPAAVLAGPEPDRDGLAKLKAHLRKAATRTFDALTKAVGDICDLFKPSECQNYFRKAGYAPH